MSGIYIPMAMPKRGHTVTLTILGGGEVCVQYYDCKPQLTVPIVYKAVPVPDHGRLIDADAFVRFIKSAIERHSYGELKLEKGLTVKDVLDAVIADLEGSGVDGFANAPTIIPKSGGIEDE